MANIKNAEAGCNYFIIMNITAVVSLAWTTSRHGRNEFAFYYLFCSYCLSNPTSLVAESWRRCFRISRVVCSGG